MAITGDYTTNEFLYKPDLGATGAEEKAALDAAFDAVDARLGKVKYITDPEFAALGTLYGNGTSDDEPFFNAVITAISTNEVTLVIPPGTYLLTDDVTFPANISVIVLNGAKLKPGASIAVSPTATFADTAGTGNISCTQNTKIVTNSGSNFGAVKEGDWIAPDSNPTLRRRVRYVQNQKLLYLWDVFDANTDVTADTWKYSGTDITFSGDHGLEHGDWISIGATPNRYYVSSLPSTSHVTTHIPPAETYSGATVTRGARVKILGNFEAGNYQCFDTPVDGGIIKLALTEVNPIWWGAIKDTNGVTAGTANTLAVNRAVWCSAATNNYRAIQAHVKFPAGFFAINGAIIIPDGGMISGVGVHGGQYVSGSRLQIYADTVKDHLILDSRNDLAGDSNVSPTRITGMQLSGTNAVSDQFLVCMTTHQIYIDNSWFDNAFLGVNSRSIIDFHNNWMFSANGLRITSDSHITNNNISISGDNVAGHVNIGIALIGGLSFCTDNILYSNLSAHNDTRIGIYNTGLDNYVTGGRIDSFDYNFVVGWGSCNLTNCIIMDAMIDGINISNLLIDLTNGAQSSVSFDCIIKNNYIKGSDAYGIHLINYVDGGIITDNVFANNTSGHIYDDNCFLASNYPLIERNMNVDLYGMPTFGVNDATPSVIIGNRFKTANNTGTTITNFDKGCNGKKIFVLVNDANTTFDFSSTNLKGHAGTDWTAGSGDFLVATFDGTNWYCECHDTTA